MNRLNCPLVHAQHALIFVVLFPTQQAQLECFPRSLGKGRYFHATNAATMLTPPDNGDEDSTISMHSKHSLVFWSSGIRGE